MNPNIPAREAVVRDLELTQAELQRGLESAIRAGSSTEKLRGKLAENADKLDAARAELQAAQVAERQQVTGALHAAATSLADEAVGRVAGAAEALAFPAVHAPDFTGADVLAAAAANVVAARSALADAEADHEAFQRDANDLARKIATKRSRIEALMHQSLAGEAGDGSHAERFALNQDIETLNGMHQQAQAKAHASLAPVNVARVAVNTAQAVAAKIEGRLLAEHLAEHAKRLDEAYTSCLRAVSEAGARAGVTAGSLVAPSVALRSWVTAGMIPRTT